MPIPLILSVFSALSLAMAGGVPLSAGLGAPETGSQPGEAAPRPFLLIDDTVIPDASVTWTARGGSATLEGPRPFAAPGQETPFEGTNITASVSLGGTRLETGAGHPKGAILRVEIRKVDQDRAFFARMVPTGGTVRLEVRGVRFNQPVRVEQNTSVVHLRYSEKDVEACSLPPEASNQFLLADPRDTLGGMVNSGFNATPGGLSGEDGLGACDARVEDDGTVTFSVEVPYGLLRHLQDPWDSVLPGTFFEPIRLHAEVEVLPAWAEPIERDHPALDEPYQPPVLEDKPAED